MRDRVYNLPIINRHEVAENTIEVRFGIKGTDFKFTPGQYVSITLPGLEHLDIREQFRDFSICSSPHDKDFFAISTRLSSSTFKDRLVRLPVKSEVIVEGPAGVFTLPKTKNQKIIFIAGGIGVTPFRSMLRWVKYKKLGLNIQLLYFNHSPKQAAYVDELLTLKEFSVYPIYKPLSFDALSAHLNKNFNTLWYIAGPPPMTAKARQILNKAGVNDKSIKSEDFSGYEEY